MILSGTRVLVVEDEALVRMMIERVLRSLGCKVVATAALLDDALTKAAALQVDVAMLDINLAGKTSYPVARVLRDRCIPFLIATGYGETQLPPDLQGAAILAKPFKIRSLEGALYRAMVNQS
jgi:CheY-like chemotaxis protein